MTGFLPIGGNGAGGFTLGPAQNVFTGADRTTAESARNTYATNNPSWLSQYNDDTNLNIRLEYTNESGDAVALYQVRNTSSTSWLDNSSATGIRGQTGAPGASGNSYFFPSVSDRDTFFSTAQNSTLLQTDLPVVVNIGENVAATFVWTGEDFPATYDSTNFKNASLESSAGSLFLGESGASLSSGNDVVGFTNPSAAKNYLLAVAYSNSGSSAPCYWDLAATTTTTPANVFSSTLTSPQTLSFTFTSNFLQTAFDVRPATAGILTVRAYIGTDSTGPNIYDERYTILASDIGAIKNLPLVNDFLIQSGTTLFFSFEGVSLFGGLQTSGPYVGQTVIWHQVTTQGATQRDLINISASETVVDNHVVTFDGTSGDQVQADGIAIIRSPSSAGLAELILQDSTGVNKVLFQHNDILDLSTIRANTNLLIEASGTNNQLTLEADGGPVTITAFQAQDVSLSSGQPGSVAAYQLTQTGTGGGVVRIGIRSDTPEGTVTAGPGSLCLVTNGALYIKQTGTGNTGWIEASKGTDGITMSNTPDDNAMIVADGTSGTEVQAVNYIKASVVGGIQNRLTIDGASSGGGVFINNDSNVLKGALFYNDTQDRIALTTENGIDLNITPSADVSVIAATAAFFGNINGGMSVASADGQVTFTSNKIQTLLPGYVFTNTIASGTSVGLSVQTNNPVGSNNGQPGDVIIRDNGASSDIYLCRQASQTPATSGWRGIFETIEDAVASAQTVAIINRNVTSSFTQGIINNQDDWYEFTGFTNNIDSTPGALVADQANNRIQIANVTDSTNGDLYEVSCTMSCAAQSGTDINYRIAVYNGSNFINTTENLILREINNQGTNFFNAINLSAVVRGPTSISGTAYFQPQFQRTTGQTSYTHVCSAIYFSVRRIG